MRLPDLWLSPSLAEGLNPIPNFSRNESGRSGGFGAVLLFAHCLMFYKNGKRKSEMISWLAEAKSHECVLHKDESVPETR